MSKHVKKKKQEYKNIQLCCDDLQSRQDMLKRWVQNPSDLSVANTAEQIQIKLLDIEKELAKNQNRSLSAENIAVKVIDGNQYNTKFTNAIISTYQSVGGTESEGSQVSGPLLSDYSSVAYRDYKAEKTVTMDGSGIDHKQIDNIQRYNGHLYCMAVERIHVYTENLAPVKTIKLDQNGFAYCRAVVCVGDKYLITASSSNNYGLRILDKEGKDLQRISPGAFYGLAMHNHKLYAYENNLNKVLIFEQTHGYYWRNSGYIYLDYNGNKEHKARQIQSFHMKKEQIYIADDTSVYHLDMKGDLKMKINQGKDKRELKNPRICCVDSKGNILVVEPESKILTVVRAEGKCGEVLIRGVTLKNVYSAIIGDENECLWVAHYESKASALSALTKYTSTMIEEVII